MKKSFYNYFKEIFDRLLYNGMYYNPHWNRNFEAASPQASDGTSQFVTWFNLVNILWKGMNHTESALRGAAAKLPRFLHIVTPWRRDMEHHLKKCVILGWFYTEMKKTPFFHFLCKNQDFWTLTHHNLSKNDRKCKIFYSEETSNLKERKYEIWYTHHASY